MRRLFLTKSELIDTLWNVNKDAKKVILEYSAN